MNLPVALRIGLRELRGGLSGFRIFLACLALGVAAIAAVGSIRAALEHGLSSEASAILGGDAEIRLTYRFASQEERAWMDDTALSVSEIVDFRSMAVVDENGDRRRVLVQAKGIDNAYPIYGDVVLEPSLPLKDALATNDGLPGMVAEPVLLPRLNVSIGDRITLGTQDFILRATLTREPDRLAAGFGLGPRIMVRLDALAASGLLKPGSLYNSQYRLQLPETADVSQVEEEAKALFSETGLRWRDRRDGTPGTSRLIERMSSFLVLVGLAGLAVGGVGVSAAVRAYLERKTETIATLKTMGATGRTIFGIYFLQIALLSIFGIVLGLVLGGGLPVLLGPVLAADLPVPAKFTFYPAPLTEAALYGALTAFIFTIWPLARARSIRAAGLFRDMAAPDRRLPPPVYIFLTATGTAALVALAVWFSAEPFLALWAAGSILGALVILSITAWITRSLARRLSHTRFVHGHPALRLALASVGGPGGEATSAILSLGLGLSVLAAIGQIDANLRGLIATELPARAPSYFFVDIQQDQLDGFLDRTKANPGISQVDTAPMLRGIITRINETPAADWTGHHWALHGDRGLTYAAEAPPNTAITRGKWWASDYTGPPLMSFAEEEALELGLELGDIITVNVLGRELSATISNFRAVDFSDMGINFLMVLNPAALQGAPHSYIATIYAQEEAEGGLLAELSDEFPNITAIGVREAIERVSETLTGLAAAIRWGASATLITGLVVLIGAAAAGERRRVFEAAVLKTLGAVRSRILGSFALRSALLGAAAGVVAIAAGSFAGWAVMTFVMESDYQFEPVPALAIVLGGILISLAAGLIFSLRPLSARPARILRSRE